ncbi:hypothetical protein [Nannocystis punicea]|uniref:Uncharacterized protein n=1 Tax=Nannocystis punicea TaxID=2995304 RepID=A0ABY7H5D3_9BACT|nr:hypothetical protein [Nannocystis poenicansa]WAS94179.1 hypothetical protein O0S08_49280 [Nannocystis poenicansa]
MEREEFARRLAEATRRLLALTRTYVIDSLPEAVTYSLAMQPWVEHVPLGPGEVLFAADGERFRERRRCNAEEAVELLWRDGLVPLWVDLVVVAVADGRTQIEAEVSPRFIREPPELQGEERPFLIKVRNNPPWIPRSKWHGPLKRFPLHWRDDPEAARAVRDPEERRVSTRRLLLRRLLAAPPVRITFAQVLGQLRERPAADLQWRDEDEQLEAIDEAEQVMAGWGEAEREGALGEAFFGDMRVRPWARLLRRVVVARVEQNAWMLPALLQSPYAAGLTGLEIRRSEVDLRAIAGSTQVRGLRRLILHDTAITEEEFAALVTTPNLAGLTHSTLSNLSLPPARLARWLDGTPGRSLRELVLAGFAGAEHLEVLLARAPVLLRLRSLGVVDGYVGDAEVLRLAACEALGGLATLDLRGSRSPISQAAAAKLRAAPHLARTQVLLDDGATGSR